MIARSYETIAWLLTGCVVAGAGVFFYVGARQPAARAVVSPDAPRAFAGAPAPNPAPYAAVPAYPTAPAPSRAPCSAAPTYAPPPPSTWTQPFAGAGTLPTPKEQGAADKVLVEGHWHGMELLELTPALARANNIDPEQTGLLVDEVSLEAAASGMRAGDVVVSVGRMSVSNLADFREATFAVRDQQAVHIGMSRAGQPAAVVLRVARALGFAMFEAASPIAPGAISPHKNHGRACTDCHIIMDKGGQLAKDAGDLLPTPPPIRRGTQPPHGERGPCTTCHTILP